MSAGNMVIHVGGKMATREQVISTPLPEIADVGERYAIVPHAEVVNLIEDRVRKEFRADGLDELDWKFALSHEGARLFGLLGLRQNDKDWGPAIAVRNSYDKSMSFGFGVGARVFVCDNLAISGDFISYTRSHVGNAMKQIREKVVAGIAMAQDHYQQTSQELARMTSREISKRKGWAVLGEALGMRVLGPTKINDLIRTWEKEESPYEYLGERTLYRLYNEMTEKMKELPPMTRLGRQAAAHALFLEHLN